MMRRTGPSRAESAPRRTCCSTPGCQSLFIGVSYRRCFGERRDLLANRRGAPEIAAGLHHRHVERRVTAAEAGATELGLGLDTDAIRSALAYGRGIFPLAASKVAVAVNVVLVLLIAGNRGACPADYSSRRPRWTAQGCGPAG
jgi:hypothetical protein